MGQPDFYNTNRHRAYPFLLRSIGAASGTTLAHLPLSAIVDAGFEILPPTRFELGTHKVYLESISRDGSTITFTFESDAPDLWNVPLIFTRDVTGELYLQEDVESPTNSQSVSYSAGEACAEPRWTGFLVTGDLQELATWLPDGTTRTRTGSFATVEPALIQNSGEAYALSINLANRDRLRASNPDGCDPLTWPHSTGGLFAQAECLRGPIRFKPGFNSIVRQVTTENRITLGASPGAGAGAPCDETAIFPGEDVADDRTTLSGSLRCSEVLRSINGQGGPSLAIIGRNGVGVTPDPENNRLVVDVDMRAMAVCYSSNSDSASES